MGPFTPPSFPEPARLIRALLVIGIVVCVAAVSFDRAVRMRYDFHHFYLDGRHVWEHVALNPSIGDPADSGNRQLGFYLPTVSLLMAPLTAFGPSAAAGIWALMQAGSLAICLVLIDRWRRSPESARHGHANGGAELLMLLAVAPALFEAARFNQLSFLVLALALLGIEALARRRDATAGMWLAAAAVIKLLPALLLAWLALRRRGRAALAMLGCGVALALLPPLIVFGPQRCGAYHAEWWRTNVGGVLATGVETAGRQPHFSDHRNQALRAVAQRVSMALGGSPAVGNAAAGLAALGVLLAFAWRARSSSPVAGVSRLRSDGALVLLVMLILSPLVRTYYLVWAIPALVVLSIGARGAWPWIGWGAWIAGIVLWPMEGARYYGVHLAMLCVIAVALVRSDAIRTNAAGESRPTE